MYEEEKGLRTPQTSSVKYIHSFRNFRQQTEEEGGGGRRRKRGIYVLFLEVGARVLVQKWRLFFFSFFFLILKEFRQPSENAPGMFIYSLLL
jgi:hypothetical protein